MSNIREDLIYAALTRAHLSIDYNIHNNFHKQYEFCEQVILANNSLTEEEKTEAIRRNNKDYDADKIFYNEGTRRICENSYWIDRQYREWNSKKQQLIRDGTHYVILKELKNVEDASQSWFEETKSHLTISNKHSEIVQCFEEEQKAFYITRSYDFSISSNSSNLGKSSNQYTPISSKDNDSEESPRLSKKLKIDNVDIQNDYEREFTQQRSNIGTNDEVQNNSSLHSEQDKSEILDDEF
ncbi:kinase-like domain-containing protein [Rhizophagus irregularis DAOM 181602=DAOM 197198]|nr:kinase-like domain-containing protein [Rhizophagus irregularis DAOM 181602=DAOM 197198]